MGAFKRLGISPVACQSKSKEWKNVPPGTSMNEASGEAPESHARF